MSGIAYDWLARLASPVDRTEPGPAFAFVTDHTRPSLPRLAGGGALGHPKIFINLDKSHERPQACSYW